MSANVERIKIRHIRMDILTPSIRLARWSSNWSIVGSHMVCTRCMSGQAPEKALLPFPHAKRCELFGADYLFPWRTLSLIVSPSAPETDQR
ncbi:hypothetical protein EC915_10417 [Pseudomonas sp. LP_7_YM]|nr:hypothetical protein EC915_10417 [Pseudomonas sp. LP_7_YM]